MVEQPGTRQSEFSISLALRETDGPPRWIELTAAVDLDRIAPYVEGFLVRRGVQGLLLQPGRADPIRSGRRMYDHAGSRIVAWREVKEREVGGGPWRRFAASVRSAVRSLTGGDRRDRRTLRALTDPDTGLPNRVHADVVLSHFVGAARRGEPLSLVMLTLDETPSLFGREAPADRLAEAARGMRESTRSADLVARYDPQTFLLGLPRCTPSGARHAVRRLRRRLDMPFVAGVGDFGPGASTVEELVATANEALERARRVAV